MRIRPNHVRFVVALLGVMVLPGAALAQTTVRVSSPDGRNTVSVGTLGGRLHYAVERDGRPVLLPSGLGFTFRGAEPLRDNLRIADTVWRAADETWTQLWGEVAQVRDHHNELRVGVVETAPPGRRFTLAVRAFDDGVAFRYEVPAQPALGEFEMTDELTEFVMADNARAWWIPAMRSERYEYLYSASPVSMLDTVHTPLTMETSDGPYVVIHEANLVDYAAMNLIGNDPTVPSLAPAVGGRRLRAWLAPWADGVKVRGRTPFVSPWRTIQLADEVTDLAPSVLGLKLNPPNVLEDTDWIEPGKYVGIWWGMHLGIETWSSGPRHGATTANTKRYIDFAAANGFGGVLVEGWNVGWDGDWIQNAEQFSFTQPYPDYDLRGLAQYARERGVRLIGHNETSMGVENYEAQLEDAFALYESLGMNAVKTGYVGDRTRDGHAHHGQYMVRHWRKVIEAAARRHLMIDAHEPIKDTGERRTYPNMMTREGARGQEYNAWKDDGGNPPEHETVLFFTRMLSGPMDFTPGVFDILLASADGPPREEWQPRVRTTLAKQLALYVVLYSPLHMAADLPENYEGQPAFQFVKDVPVDWEQTRVLAGAIGDYVVVARQERGGRDWYVGAVSDEEPREVEIPLSFLTPGTAYVAQIYADGPDADWRTNPLAIAISERRVNATTRLTLTLAPGGGQAIRIRPADAR